jgi:hypothetical protein
MKLGLSARGVTIARWVALGAAVALLCLAAAGMAITTAVAPDLVSRFAGVRVSGSGDLGVVGTRTSQRAVGDVTVFTFRTGTGPSAGSVLPTDFPVPPGATVTRSAIYRDAVDTYRSTLASVPTDAAAAAEWYRSQLASAGWSVERVPAAGAPTGIPSTIVARKEGLTARVDFASGDGLHPAPSSAFGAGSAPFASVVGVYVTGR